MSAPQLPMSARVYGVGRRRYRLPMHVFMDDSASGRSPGYQCFAGFLATEERLNVLSEDWNKLLARHSLRFLHTSDFLAGHGDHRGLDLDYEQRKDVVREFVRVIRRSMNHCIVVGVESIDYHKFSPKQRKGLSPVGFCLKRVARAAHRRLIEHPHPSPLNFVFDDSSKDSPKIYSAWADLRQRTDLDRKLVASITFADDSMLYPLQAADLLACGIIQEYSKNDGQWSADSAFGEMFDFEDVSPLSMSFDHEHWNKDNLGAVFTPDPGPVETLEGQPS